MPLWQIRLSNFEILPSLKRFSAELFYLVLSRSAKALFIMLYKVVLTFEFVDKIPKFDHSNESY